MKTTSLLLAAGLSTTLSFAQQDNYDELVKKAEDMYKARDYKNSAFTYSDAFRSIGGKAIPSDRYNAACCWAMANYPDSAFYHLNYNATVANDTMYAWAAADQDLVSLHKDKRWKRFLALEKANKEKAEANLNKPLMAQLEAIYDEDQKYRRGLDSLEERYGRESQQIKDQWKIIQHKDSVNLVAVDGILKKYGWLGPDVVGSTGSSTFFFVIQHADIKTQEHYLPLLRDAVIQGKAQAGHLALMEDRVALRQGKKQIYGSQVGTDPNTKQDYVLPLEDPDNVDQRREQVGLQPMAQYLGYFGLKWDVEQYKREQAAREQQEKK